MNALVLLVVLAASPVREVVVFPDRAQVTRSEKVACKGGRAQAVFEGIPPAADPSTVRAIARGAQVQGLRAFTRTREQALSAELESVKTALEAVQLELAAVDDALAQAQAQERLGMQYGQVAGSLLARELVTPRPDLRAWKNALDHSSGAQLAAAAEQAKLVAQRREITDRLTELQRRFGELFGAAARTEHVAEVVVRCPGAGSATVDLSYLVGGASWSPTYEARAEEGAGRVELATFATVTQRTGEDWRGAKLILSTALPTKDATPPEPRKLEVLAQERKEQKKVLVRREERVRHAHSGGVVTGEEDTGLRARAQGLSVQLDVPEPADVPGNGTPVRLFVGRTRMKAAFAWQTAPQLQPVVFRLASLTNQAPFPLLPGGIDVFRAGGFIGRHALEHVPQGGRFELTFGLHELLKVKRIVVSEIARDQGLFGSSRRFRYAYRIELSNHDRAPQQVELTERVPISELDDVTVRIEETTTQGFEHRAQDGQVVWKLKLGPGQTRTVVYAFYVDVPQSYEMGGL